MLSNGLEPNATENAVTYANAKVEDASALYLARAREASETAPSHGRL
jgi:hypothetical protein